ncbi:MAG TPA: VWA domain-containing protein [Bryobacteraceae bacterium]|nr:VWA domain-containing protein [Bryobacteraceae bacterium]
MKISSSGAAMVVLSASFTFAQSPAPSGQPAQPPAPVFRSTTRLIQLNVVVQNRKGEPVSDLRKEDFTVFENKKPQQIAVFSMDSTAKRIASESKLPQNIFSNRLAARTGVPGSVTVLLIDSLNTRWQDQVYAKQQVRQFLQQIQPGDHIAVYSLGRGLKILHDYTTDASTLLQKLAKFQGENLPDLAASERPSDSGTTGDVLGLASLGESSAAADFYTANRVVNTLKALEAIAAHLAGIPGRKNLIWLSGGFPLNIGFDEIPEPGKVSEKRSFSDEMDTAIRALNNANLAVYPVDARGLITLSEFSADNPSTAGAQPQPSLKPTVENLDTMEELASRTGGRASYNSNDLKNAIRRAMEDSRVSYTIGFYSADPTPDNKFRELKVKVDRPGVSIRHRKGYFALRDVKQDDKTRQKEVRNAVWSPLDSTAVGMNARVDLFDVPKPDTVHVYTQIDPANVTLTEHGGRWLGKLDIVFVQKDAQGHEYAGIADSLNLNVTRDNYAKILKNGIIYSRSFSRQPQASTLRIVVRDAGSGSTGSLSVPFLNVAKIMLPPAPERPR